METIIHFADITGIHGFMNSKWGWPAVESLHFIGLALLMGSVGLFDFRLLGVAPAIPTAALHKLIPWGVFGFILNLFTGMLFFVSDPGQYLYNPAFQLKMLCILIAGLNMLLFYTSMKTDMFRLPQAGPAPAAASMMALVSLTCWSGVIIFGRLITFYRPPEHWCFWC